MNENVIRFPGFIIIDRGELLKDGKHYNTIKALIADLPLRDLRRTFHWNNERHGMGYRNTMLRRSIEGSPHDRQQGGAA